MTMISIKFEDFKNLAGNHRVYYYVGEDYYDFLYLVDGVIVKTSVLDSDIANRQQFFSDRLFYGAVQLTFPINEPNQDLFNKIVGIKRELDAPVFKVNDFQDEEVKNIDIQREGVDE